MTQDACFKPRRSTRSKKQVTYEENSLLLSKNSFKPIELKPKELTILGSFIECGYEPQIEHGDELWLSCSKIIKEDNSFFIFGEFKNTSNSYKEYRDMNVLPYPMLISILSPIIDENSMNKTILNCYKSYGKKYRITDDISLFKKDDVVLYKPYNSNDAPLHATVVSVRPHTVVGDFSSMYDIQINDENIAVYEGQLRSEDWKQSETDNFDVTFAGIIEYEALRAIKLGKYEYLDTEVCLLDPLPWYLDIKSVFFNEKKHYLATVDHIEGNNDITYQLFCERIKLYIFQTIKKLKPKSLNGVEDKLINNDLYPVTVLPFELYLALEQLEETLNVYYYTAKTIWFTFTNITDLTDFCGINSADLVRVSKKKNENRNSHR